MIFAVLGFTLGIMNLTTIVMIGLAVKWYK